MGIALYLKNNLKNIPPGLGRIINYIPYEKRPGLGKIYSKRKSEIEYLSKASVEEKQKFVFERMEGLISFAYENVQFYKEFYEEAGFHPSHLLSFSDLGKVPIITKSVLNKYNIEQRSAPVKDRYVVNTGGSSGTPFAFYIEPSSMGHEWAHMHTIWGKLDYSPSDLKIVFGGRSDIQNKVEYDVVRNHFAIDIYEDYDKLAEQLFNIFSKYKIKYLHGYPSSIYDFALYCENRNEKLKKLIRTNLQGVFLGSEFPHKLYRDTIEGVLGAKTISWYGHTERAVLAFERQEKFTYEPFLSYGFSEAIQNEAGEYELISTSYYNHASPLIRYNTQDIIESPICNDGILESFKILKGREGEFVIDSKGKKINLTALIFGRHHRIFNFIDYMQIRQIDQGIIEVIFVGNDLPAAPEQLFDSTNLDFKISFKKVKEPIRTQSGKLSLLVK